MSEIVSAKHLYRRGGFLSLEDWIKAQSTDLFRRGILSKPYLGVVDKSMTILARIDFGRWIADCPFCKGAEYVEPDQPLFFCLSCGMAEIEGKAVEVKFPSNRLQIEAAILEREVEEIPYAGLIEKAIYAKPCFPGASRSWKPGESVSDLKDQYRAAKKAKG